MRTLKEIACFPMQICSLRVYPFLFSFSFFIGISFFASAQRSDWKTRIDKLVEKADSLSFKEQTVFHSERLIKNQDPIQETWYYTLDNNKVAIFQVRYVIKGTEFTEVYYLNNNELICAEKVEAPNLSVYIDEVVRGELYFIENSALRQYVTFGQKNAGTSHRDAQYECIRRFQQRFEELRRNMEIVNVGRKRG